MQVRVWDLGQPRVSDGVAYRRLTARLEDAVGDDAVGLRVELAGLFAPARTFSLTCLPGGRGAPPLATAA